MDKNIQSIFHHILLYQRHNSLVSEREMAESIIMILLDAEKSLNVTEIIKYLDCPQSYLSHLLKSMSLKALIKVAKDSSDNRQSFYSLSAKGQAYVKELDTVLNERLKALDHKLTKDQLVKLAHFINKISDHSGLPASSPRKEHVLRSPQRRLAALMGVTGRKVLGVDISSTKLHLFKIIHDYSGCITAQDIAEELHISAASVSIFLKENVRKKFLRLTESPEDQRVRYIAMTDAGIKHYHEFLGRLHGQFAKLIAEFKEHEISEWQEIMSERFDLELIVNRVKTASYQTIRPQMIQMCISNHNISYIPAEIAGENCEVFEISDKSSLLMYVQLKRHKIDFCCWSNQLKKYKVKPVAESFIKRQVKSVSETLVSFQPLKALLYDS